MKRERWRERGKYVENSDSFHNGLTRVLSANLHTSIHSSQFRLFIVVSEDGEGRKMQSQLKDFQNFIVTLDTQCVCVCECVEVPVCVSACTSVC